MSHKLALTVPQTIRRMGPKLALGPPNGAPRPRSGTSNVPSRLQVKLPARVARKSMNRVQKQKHLAQANRHIAELAVQLARQRVIVKQALATGQRSEMAESLLDALEGSLRIFESHRIFLLSRQRRSKRII